ncbi:PREDICTED: homocysteine-responsive endoplasmic reticulum-resident ubiquitin-like domain member 1 protein isoform X2 [Chrysochloris asiatica]|uniref:Homocysteine-responsive endoplasmic reticulum-resident ubiquitin-like domain member 1 protein isoform X2 n=1 Tax=Chrysochloris asiatica TaxID=185453 RepID=A0A9B0WQL0_CHRAS|nr:PREDICTED: homocysteine-responsive endoplasmic reticulum-resident ubiquitin-like domain member 1 protein isoform X2 [Chrysochloris asiatica]
MEPDPQPELELVTILVKSPNQRHRDLELSCDRGWSVGQLKAHLSRVYPERPRPQDQRLIYSGKLLLDHLSLRDLLPKEERHVLHLVCNVRTPSKTPEASAKIAESTDQPIGPNQGPCPGDSSSDGLRQREVLRNLPPSGWENISRPEAAQQTFQGLGPGFSGYTTYGWLQFSWFQQIYARQYYMQYLAATAASGAFVPSPGAQEIPVVSAPAPAPIHNQFPAENQPANQNAPAQVVVNPGANQNLRMNAQGGPIVEEDDEINRDWLDWTYSAATFSVFLSILYFYSSLSRFLMVMGATVLMYLHHVGWFPFRQRPAPNFPNDGLPYEAVNQDPNNNLQEEGSDPETEDPNHLPPDRDVVDEEQTSPSFMSTAWLVFKTFFASLLPEGPPAIAN